MNAKPTAATTTTKAQRPGNDQQHHALQLDRLPVDPAVRRQALIKLQSPTGNARNVAAIIERCPVLSLQLFCETNRQLSQSDNHCQNLVHAIGLLGVPRIEQRVKKAVILNDKQISSDAKEGYQRAIASSLLAADWVKQWSKLSPHWQAYGAILTWATLFQRAPLWALWLEDSDAMIAREYQRATRGGAGLPEIAGFGAPTVSIIEAVSKQWHLPELCQQSWQPTVIGSGKDWLSLQIGSEQQRHAHFCHHPAFAVALANQLADQTSWCWSDHRTARLLKLLAGSLNSTRAASLSHQQVANSSRQRGLPFASELLCDYQRSVDLLDRRTAPAETIESAKCEPPGSDSPPAAPPMTKPAQQAVTVNQQATSSDTSTAQLQPPLGGSSADADGIGIDLNIEPAPAIEPPAEPNHLQTALIRLIKQPDSFEDQHQVFKYLLQTLNEQLKLSRCSAAVYSPANNQLRTLYSLGVIDSPALKNFRYQADGNGFFNMLLKKPVSFRLHTDNYQKFWPLLPRRFREAIKTPQFFMMSLFVDNKPFAFVYADCAGQITKLSDSQYQQFKQLCIATSRCLDAVKSR